MRRTVLVLLFLAVAGLVLLFLPRRSEPNAPQFLPAPSVQTIHAYTFVQYEFLSSTPFEGDKMWLLVQSGTTNYHYLLFDIERRRVLGELTNAQPVFSNREQTSLLCVNWSRSSTQGLKGLMVRLIERISFGKMRLGVSGLDTEVFWVLSLDKNTAARIGKIPQLAGLRISFQPSQDFRLGVRYIRETGPDRNTTIAVCDLLRKRFLTVNTPGAPAFWWDSQSIVLKDSTNNFLLYNVAAGNASPFISAREITAFLLEANISDADSARANLFTIWNGREYDFYLTDTHKKWLATNSFLAKVERPHGKLKLLYRDFKFEWSDHLDASGILYLYSGRTPGEHSSAVLLRYLKKNSSTTLVESDDSKRFSTPRFYGNSVVYVRSNALWRIDLNGSNNTRLFPPP